MRAMTVVWIVLTVCLAGCASGQRATEVARPAKISHVVFVKLKEPSAAIELIAACEAELATIPGVVSFACGPHLDTGRGERVVSDYDVGIYLGFDSRETLDGYMAHPKHTALVSAWQPRLEWLRVHDFIDESQ